MARDHPVQRLFVAIHPPPEVVAALRPVVASLDPPDHRVTLDEQVHVTMLFLGDVSAGDFQQACESVKRSVAGVDVFSLRVVRVGSFPPGGPARIVAADTDVPSQLLEIRRRLVHRFGRHPRTPDRKPFRPHMTLARLIRPSRQWRAEQWVDGPIFDVRLISLVRSELRQSGALHSIIESVPISRVS